MVLITGSLVKGLQHRPRPVFFMTCFVGNKVRDYCPWSIVVRLASKSVNMFDVFEVLWQFFNTRESQIGSTAVLFIIIDFALKAVNFVFQHENVLGFHIKLILKIQNVSLKSRILFESFSGNTSFHFLQYDTVVKNSNDFHNELVIIAYLLRGAGPFSFQHDWCGSVANVSASVSRQTTNLPLMIVKLPECPHTL